MKAFFNRQKNFLNNNFYFRDTWKLTLLSTFIIGIITHTYKFTNTLLNHDSLLNFYSTQNLVGSGRWFLSAACCFSSYFDLPWINGILSLFFISLTAITINEIFNVKNKLQIILISGILVTFPSVTATFFYEFTADGYMLSMFLSAISFLLVKTGFNQKIYLYLVLGVVFLCLSCGIYQTYVSFYLLLFLCYTINMLINKNYKLKKYLTFILCNFIVFALAILCYYVIWKLCIAINNITVADYKGIDNVGSFNIHYINAGIVATIRNLADFLFISNIQDGKVNCIFILNILVVCIFFINLFYNILIKKIYKNIFKLLLLVLCVVIIPFAICIWLFVSTTLSYYIVMYQSLSLIYIYGIISLNINELKIKQISLVCIYFAVIFNNIIQANICYFVINQCNQATFAESIKYVVQIDESMNKINTDKLVIIGNDSRNITKHFYNYYKKAPQFISIFDDTLIYNSEHLENYFIDMLNKDYDYINDNTIKDYIINTNEFKAAPDFSVLTIDDMVVLKLIQ